MRASRRPSAASSTSRRRASASASASVQSATSSAAHEALDAAIASMAVRAWHTAQAHFEAAAAGARTVELTRARPTCARALVRVRRGDACCNRRVPPAPVALPCAPCPLPAPVPLPYAPFPACACARVLARIPAEGARLVGAPLPSNLNTLPQPRPQPSARFESAAHRTHCARLKAGRHSQRTVTLTAQSPHSPPSRQYQRSAQRAARRAGHQRPRPRGAWGVRLSEWALRPPAMPPAASRDCASAPPCVRVRARPHTRPHSSTPSRTRCQEPIVRFPTGAPYSS